MFNPFAFRYFQSRRVNPPPLPFPPLIISDYSGISHKILTYSTSQQKLYIIKFMSVVSQAVFSTCIFLFYVKCIGAILCK